MRESNHFRENDQPDLVKGVVAGLLAGLFASWTMNQFQAAWTRIQKGYEKPHGAQSMQPSEGKNSGQSEGQAKEQEDDATVKAAKAISEHVFDHRLKSSEEKPAGAAVHYAFGASTGGLYGAIAEYAPAVTVGAGLPFGAAFWAVADETVVPLLGLSKGPTEYPVLTHAYALASHLVYGLTTEVTRRAVRSIL